MGSCFLAKMACISPTKSRVKHRTLNKILTFFSALSTRPTVEVNGETNVKMYLCKGSAKKALLVVMFYLHLKLPSTAV